MLNTQRVAPVGISCCWLFFLVWRSWASKKTHARLTKDRWGGSLAWLVLTLRELGCCSPKRCFLSWDSPLLPPSLICFTSSKSYAKWAGILCCCVKSTAAWIYPWTDSWVCQVGKGTFGERLEDYNIYIKGCWMNTVLEFSLIMSCLMYELNFETLCFL